MSAFLKTSLDLGRKSVSTQEKKIILPESGKLFLQKDNNLREEGRGEPEVPGQIAMIV